MAKKTDKKSVKTSAKSAKSPVKTQKSGVKPVKAASKAAKVPAKAGKVSSKSSKVAGESAKGPAKSVKAPAKKPVAVKPAAKTSAEVKRVPPRIIRKVPVAAKVSVETYHEVDTKAAVAFASSIAQEMKRSAAEADQNRLREEIRLSRRPTTRAQGCNTEKFPEASLKEFRKRLLDARETAMRGVDAMRATGFNESEDHEADGGDGTNQTLRLQALGQMGNIHRTIQQIEEALHRIDDGTYGVCTSCGQLIRKPRLMNQPFVLTCMECQSEMERKRQ
jgi:RNA polymerase-binding transcription factor DksA